MRFFSMLLLFVWPGGGLALAEEWEPDGLEAAVVQLAWVSSRTANGDPEALARARKAHDRYVELAPKQNSSFQQPWVDYPTSAALMR